MTSTERRRRAAHLIASCDGDVELLEWLRDRCRRRLASADGDLAAAADELRAVELALAWSRGTAARVPTFRARSPRQVRSTTAVRAA